MYFFIQFVSGVRAERLRELFERQVPLGDTDMFVDNNVEEEPLRAVRYFSPDDHILKFLKEFTYIRFFPGTYTF